MVIYLHFATLLVNRSRISEAVKELKKMAVKRSLEKESRSKDRRK